MRKSKVILKREFAHDRTGRLDPSELPSTLVRIADGARCPTEGVSPEEHQLVMDIGHRSLIGQLNGASSR
jgi:hypothetical protein